MAKYTVTCNDGSFEANFSGSIPELISSAACVVAGMYRHIQRHDDTGFAAIMFKELCMKGILFDEKNFEPVEDSEQYSESIIAEGSKDVQ